MNGTGLKAMRGFLTAARGNSQERIIIEFLDAVINVNKAADRGSVLINHPRAERLILFNEGDFLFNNKILDPTKEWPREFGYFDGVAARAFRQGNTMRYSKHGPAAGDFIGNSPIENMVCIPIITTQGPPFGVVCFHNDDPEKKFDDEEVEQLEAYVDILGLALHTPHPELQLERNVFIVHGRDEGALNGLKVILDKYKVNPRTLGEEEKKAESILKGVEDLLRICKAGFILVTPDDEGHLCNSSEPLTPRARENVIFETGLLFAKFREFKRVMILLKRPVELPSDLHGIGYEPFTNLKDIEMRIFNALNGWGLKPEVRSGR